MAHYCWLRVHDCEGKRKQAVIEVTRHPEIHLLALNIGLIASPAGRSSAALMWRPVAVVGPFPTHDVAVAFSRRWLNTGRLGINHRCDTAAQLAAEYQVACYTLRASTQESERASLENIPGELGIRVRAAYEELCSRNPDNGF